MATRHLYTKRQEKNRLGSISKNIPQTIGTRRIANFKLISEINLFNIILLLNLTKCFKNVSNTSKHKKVKYAYQESPHSENKAFQRSKT